ncbi:unnamed protein product [Phaedon cochleariae]|uniref:MADF domain-containing protein n=1 Tax=Phaedon cochleariae TaxID=80249 RepID=A0A9N9SJP3_PHACE|nr:unnamed protein product [Phaedon cochleariae]
MSWDNEKTLSFIKEYERRPILWRKNDKLYYNIVKKEDAWREIASIFEEDIAVLKKKIESLRGSRRREKTRMLTSMRTGTGRKDVYVSKWFAWDSFKVSGGSRGASEYNIKHSDHSQVLENEHTAESTEDDVQRNSDNSTKDDQVERNIALSKKIINPKEKSLYLPSVL